MFLTKDELKSAIYAYQLSEITEMDDGIVEMAITAATDEAKSYLRPNRKSEWMDGRAKYDVDAVFNAAGTARNSLLMEMVKSIAVWYVVRLCNVDMIYENLKDRYDRAIDWLKKVNKGEITLDLALLPDDDTDTNTQQPFRFGSRPKFNHDINPYINEP